jgi:hypothetical protein
MLWPPVDLIHYGKKGMQRQVTKQEQLGRIYRIEAGTSTRKERIQKALKKPVKEISKEQLDEFFQRIGSTKMCDITITEE